MSGWKLLQRLVPALEIAERCSFEGSFLKVRGDRHVYKIHLGSASVQMEPDDRYLCLVPQKSENDDGPYFLPFEGDFMLSTILSKAFLLADDTRAKIPL